MTPLLQLERASEPERERVSAAPQVVSVSGRAGLLLGDAWQPWLAEMLASERGRAEIVGIPLAAGLRAGTLGWFDGAMPWDSQLTVGEALGWSAGLLGISRRAALNQLPAQAHRVGIPWPGLRARARLAQVDAADRSWLRLGAALLGQPRALVLCNPFDALGDSSRERMARVLQRLLQEGVGWLVISEARAAGPEWSVLEQLVDDTLWMSRGAALWQRTQHDASTGLSLRVSGSERELVESLSSVGYSARLSPEAAPGQLDVHDPQRLGVSPVLRHILSLEIELLELGPLEVAP